MRLSKKVKYDILAILFPIIVALVFIVGIYALYIVTDIVRPR